MSAKTLMLFALVAPVLVACGYDSPTIIRTCSRNSEVREIHIWRDSASLYPRSPGEELLAPTVWQGIERTMSRSEVEAVLAPHLRSRKADWSEFDTPLGRLRWSLDREFSGGIEAKIQRVYLYPARLSLKDVLGAGALTCLKEAGGRPRYVVVKRSDRKGQLATLEVDGLAIKQVIWRQRSDEVE